MSSARNQKPEYCDDLKRLDQMWEKKDIDYSEIIETQNLIFDKIVKAHPELNDQLKYVPAQEFLYYREYEPIRQKVFVFCHVKAKRIKVKKSD